MMNSTITPEELREEYNYLRKAAKQLFWAAQNLSKAAAIRMPEAEDEIPKNQTFLPFEDEL